METDAEEEGLRVLLREFGDAVVGDAPVGDVLILAIERGKLDAADAVALAGRHARRGPATAFALEVVVPLAVAAIGLVVDFSRTRHAIAGVAKCRGEHLVRRDERAEVDVVFVDARGRWAHPRHERGARGIADRRGAVGACERHAQLGEPVEVRRLRLRIVLEVADPVAQIVDGDEEDVGFLRRRGGGETSDAGEQHHDTKEEAGECVHGKGGKLIPARREVDAGFLK